MKPIPNGVVLRQDLFGAGVVNRIVNQIQSRLAVEVDSDRGGMSSRPRHLELELSKETGVLPSHGQPHVLALGGAETGISYGRHRDVHLTQL